MGKIVAAMATVHAPQLFTRPPEEDPKQLDAGVAAMRQLGRLLDETKPEALVIFASDHMETFFLQSVPTFCIVAGDRAHASFAGRDWDLPIHKRLAEALLDGLVRRGFDMCYSQDAVMGHSFAAPFEWVLEGRNIAVVPVFINTYLPPLPTPARCAALGKAIAEIVSTRPERVALLASGGMSHYPGTWKYYKPAFDFDHWCIGELENGHSESFLKLTPEQLDEVGNTEMLPWAPVLGAVGEQHMEMLSYQETPHHGHAVAIFRPGAPLNPRPPQQFRFHNHPYHFYDHPSVSAYKLNKLLYDSRYKANLRLRMFEDIDAVAAEYGLVPEDSEALRETFRFRHINSEKPALDAEALVNRGAHPVGALMAVHVLQQEQRKFHQTEEDLATHGAPR